MSGLFADIDNLEFLGHNEANPYHLMDVEIVGNTAYVANGLGAGFEAYDITNPASPQRFYVNGPSTWRIQSYGDTLAAAFSRRDGVQLYDISTATPSYLGEYDPPGAAEALEGGDVIGDYLYCAAHQNGIYTIDISNPANPQKINEFSLANSAVWNIVSKDSFLIVANGRHGVVVVGTTGGLHITAQLSLDGCANDVNFDGNIAVVSLGVHGLATVDVSDPYSPVLLDIIETDGCVWGSGVANHLVISGSWFVMELFDITNPSSIQRVGWDNTKTWAHGADIRNDSLIVVADWRGMSCYRVGPDANPDIDVYPLVLDYGSVSGSVDTTVMVRNTGSNTLSVTSITLPSGITTDLSSFSVAAGDSQELIVTATGSGSTYDNIFYYSNDPDEVAFRQEVYKNNTSYPQVGSAAPDFNLYGTDGQYHSISGNFGKVIYLEFGGAW
jgi:hypothetical protein